MMAVLDKEKFRKAFNDCGKSSEHIAEIANGPRDVHSEHIESLLQKGMEDLGRTVKILKAMGLSPEEYIKKKVIFLD